MSFKPAPEEAKKFQVPYFEDAKSGDGWQGHATTKHLDTLKSEVMLCVNRIGGHVTSFTKGSFTVDGRERLGYQLFYSIEDSTGNMFPGRIDVAGLPVRNRSNSEKSLKMALYMLKIILDGMYFMQCLSPGYLALMPGVIMPDGKTLMQSISESSLMAKLLPAGADFLDGEAKEL